MANSLGEYLAGLKIAVRLSGEKHRSFSITLPPC